MFRTFFCSKYSNSLIPFFKVILMFARRKLLNYTLVNQSHSFLFFSSSPFFPPIVVLITGFDFNATNIFFCQHRVYNYSERERDTHTRTRKKRKEEKNELTFFPFFFFFFFYLTNNASSIRICKNNMRNANTL